VPGNDALIQWWRRLPVWVVDTALAGVFALVTVISVVVADSQDSGVHMSTAGWVWLAIELVPLIWRRRWPVAVFIISITAAVVYGALHLPDPPVMFGPLLATYTVAAYRPRRITLPLMGSVVIGAAFAIAFGDGSDAADVAVGYFAGITAWVVGDTLRTQREHTAWVAERRAEETRQATTRERLAIARDLHDIVAHNVSVIAVQAEAAQSVLDREPARAGRAMADVADTARTTLVELRRLLGVLRSEHELAPQPDLDAIDELVDTVRRAGMDVSLSRSGNGTPVDAVTGLTAYRVVQEALTNVLKHAGPCATDVGLDVGSETLVVTVTDNGAAPRSSSDGHGLVGMRERVAVLGGTLKAGPGATGGFTVRAELPLTA
jgi:signal transduction histidine kinase